MSFLPLFHWLAHTHIGIAMRDATWAFAIVEVVHLIALAMSGGAILLLDLRLMGVGLTSQPASEVAREFLPLTLGGVVVMFLTGLLLLASGPMRYYYNTPFRIKMGLFVLATIVHFTLQIRVSRQDPVEGRATPGQKAAGAISLLLWSSIGIAGRAIGYF
jgi:uncharacterized membrane protein